MLAEQRLTTPGSDGLRSNTPSSGKFRTPFGSLTRPERQHPLRSIQQGVSDHQSDQRHNNTHLHRDGPTAGPPALCRAGSGSPGSSSQPAQCSVLGPEPLQRNTPARGLPRGQHHTSGPDQPGGRSSATTEPSPLPRGTDPSGNSAGGVSLALREQRKPAANDRCGCCAVPTKLSDCQPIDQGRWRAARAARSSARNAAQAPGSPAGFRSDQPARACAEPTGWWREQP